MAIYAGFTALMSAKVVFRSESCFKSSRGRPARPYSGEPVRGLAARERRELANLLVAELVRGPVRVREG